MHINSTSLIGKSICMETTHKAQKMMTYQNIANPHKWLKYFPNLSRTSQVGKIMSELSRRWKKMVILENGGKVMKDGLATKGPSFLV